MVAVLSKGEIPAHSDDDALGPRKTKVRHIGPQPGPQEKYLATDADIAVYGGSAGGGKTYALCLEPLQYVTDMPDFHSVFFRRTMPEHLKAGGIRQEARALYAPLGARFNHRNVCQFPGGGTVTLAHLEHEDDKLSWSGAQIPLICFDELTSFTRTQFFFMLSRNRSMCGVRPYIRCTCNPDADSWVADFLAWWIDQETGFPIPERAGVLRYFIRNGEEILWGDSKRELIDQYGNPDLSDDDPEQERPMSVTFIPAKVFDNKILLAKNPQYLANLRALNQVDRARLLEGNWKIRPSAGLLFQRSWCRIVDVAPAALDVVRYWDLAATVKTQSNNPDWTVGVKLGRTRSEPPAYYVLHVERLRVSPRGVRAAIRAIAEQDGQSVRVGIPQDPGQAGKDQALDIIASMGLFEVRALSENRLGDKVTRFGPFSAQAEAGNVSIVRGAWNDAYFTALENFPDGKKDDADASAGALRMHTSEPGALIWMREQAELAKAARNQA